MTPEEIIELAKQVGASPSSNPDEYDVLKITYCELEAFAKLVAEKERKEFDVLFAEHQKLLGELQAMRLARDEEDFC